MYTGSIDVYLLLMEGRVNLNNFKYFLVYRINFYFDISFKLNLKRGILFLKIWFYVFILN